MKLRTQILGRTGDLLSDRIVNIDPGSQAIGPALRNVVSVFTWERGVHSVEIKFSDRTGTRWTRVDEDAPASSQLAHDRVTAGMWCGTHCQTIRGHKMHRTDCPMHPERSAATVPQPVKEEA